MTPPAEILTQPLFRAIAAALVHFLWQGTLVAVLLWVGNRILRRSSAQARYAAACGALAVMLALPALTVWRLQVRRVATPPGPGAPSATSTAPAPGRTAAAPSPAQPDSLTPIAPWIVSAWLSGVCFFSIRFLGGYLAAQRLRHRGICPAGEVSKVRLRELAARLRVSRPVRLLESTLVEVPTAVGILRPLILLPAGIATGMAPQQLDSLLAHELAHVARGDYLINLFQALAETLLFYHPAVWWISGRIRIERENVCDDLAVAVTGNPVAYARALVGLAERRDRERRLVVAADGGRLWKRITRLAKSSEPPAGPSPRWLAAAMALAGVLALGAAARVPAASDAAEGTQRAPAPSPTARPHGPDTAPVEPARREGSAQRAVPRSAPGAAPESRAILTPEELVAFRIHGVTPEFIGGIVALGYDKASPQELVALRIHGVTTEFIREMTATFGHLPLEEYTTFRIHGLTPESSRSLRAAFGTLSADEAVSLRIHGVDADFAKAFSDAGYAKPSAEEAISLRIHGVDPADAAAWKRLGFGNPSLDELVSLRIHGATPEFAGALRAEGLRDFSLDDLVSMRIHGVTPEFVHEIRALGYASLTADDLMAFRIHGVTPGWIRAANGKAGARLSAEDLLDWRIHERRTDREVEEEP